MDVPQAAALSALEDELPVETLAWCRLIAQKQAKKVRTRQQNPDEA